MQTETPGQDAPDLRRIGLHPDHWYPLARSKDLETGSTLLASYAGEPIVLARSERGQVFALDDRCAHRQFPLHKGVVCGELLRCAYHAWSYHQDGRVAAVPYLPRGTGLPRGIKSFACREAYGYVFVFPGDRAQAERATLPELPTFHAKSHETMHFWREVHCHYSFMHENLMDMNHQFLHRGILGTIRPALVDYQTGADWVEVRYRFKRAAGKAHRGADLMLAGRSGDDAGRGAGAGAAGDLMTIRTQYPYQTLSVCRDGSTEPAFDLWAVYVPCDREQRRHVSVGLLMIRKPSVPGLIRLFWPFIRRFTESVFAEDRAAVEAEQRAYDRQGADWNQEINPVILAVRAVLARNGVPLAPAAPAGGERRSEASGVAHVVVGEDDRDHCAQIDDRERI